MEFTGMCESEKTPEQCRIEIVARKQAHKDALHAQGLCIKCFEPVGSKHMKCKKCRIADSVDKKSLYYVNGKQNTNYALRKTAAEESGVCLYCYKPALPDCRTCDECRIKFNKRTKENHRKSKDIVFAAYGGYRCACCNYVDTHEFFSIDHIIGNGSLHRKEIGLSSGTHLYQWLKKNKYPAGFQVLCHSCNFAKKNNKECPHKIYEREKLAKWPELVHQIIQMQPD